MKGRCRKDGLLKPQPQPPYPHTTEGIEEPILVRVKKIIQCFRNDEGHKKSEKIIIKTDYL